MKVSNLMGVPNAQMNAYIRKLSFYQSRAGRGHRVGLPEMPTFVTSFDEDDTEQANLIEQIDNELSQWGEVETQDGDNRRLSHHTDHTIDSNYTNQSKQSRKGRAREGELQKSDLLARKYGALMLEDSIGNTVQRTEKGDPMSVKSYGWRLVAAKQVTNPHLVIPFSETLKNGEHVDSSLVYIGIGNGDNGVVQTLEDANRGSSDKLLDMSSQHPRLALAYGMWRCKYGKTALHNPADCGCQDKTKHVLVCATAQDESGAATVVPVRVETFVWKPDSVEEVKAYAEFAREVACQRRKLPYNLS